MGFSLAFGQKAPKIEIESTGNSTSSENNSSLISFGSIGMSGHVRRRRRDERNDTNLLSTEHQVAEPSAPAEEVLVSAVELAEEVETQTLLGREDAELFSSMTQLTPSDHFMEDVLQEIIPGADELADGQVTLPGQTRLLFQQKARDVREESERVMDEFKREFIDKVLDGVEKGMQGWIEDEVSRLEDVMMRSNAVVRKLYLQATNLQAQKTHLTERLSALEPTRMRLLAVEHDLTEKQREYRAVKKIVGKVTEELEMLTAKKRKVEQHVAGIVKFASVISTIRDGVFYGLIFAVAGCIIVWFWLLIR